MFPEMGGPPKWMVYFMENPIYWMITRGSPGRAIAAPRLSTDGARAGDLHGWGHICSADAVACFGQLCWRRTQSRCAKNARNARKITLLRVIPSMTFQNSLLTQLLSEAFVTALWPTNYPNRLFHLAGHCACQSVKLDINMSVGHVK